MLNYKFLLTPSSDQIRTYHFSVSHGRLVGKGCSG